MKHVSIIIPEGDAILSSIVGPYKVFKHVNQYLAAHTPKASPFYDLHLVGLHKSHRLYNGLFSIHPNKCIGEVKNTDLVIIPAFYGEIDRHIALNKAFYPWLKRMHSGGAELASLCVGAFFLASTGLMDGKRCTTHWASASAFREMFPKVELIEEKVITDEKGIYSSGGAYSFLNLILHLVEKFNGREIALWCAKMFEAEIDRVSQLPFAIFQGQKTHADEPVKKAQVFIESNIDEKISIEQLANRFALSRRNFIRRFKKATQNTPIEYLQRVRIEAAKKSLESSDEPISEVMFKVGYSDRKAFRNVFRKITGLTPLEYKLRYNRELALAYS